MDIQDLLNNAKVEDQPENLLNDAGDVKENVLNPPQPVVSGPANLLKITSDEIHLGLLHSKIKCNANVPINPRFNAMKRKEFRPFKLCLPDGFKASALAFFKLFFTDYIFRILVENTNLHAAKKDARTSRYSKGRRWKPIDKHQLSVFIALHVYIRLSDNSNIESYWIKDKFCVHRPMHFMPWYRFEQIKRYFHVSPPTDGPIIWYMKLSPLFEYLRAQFKLYCIPASNVSVDEMMKAFYGRSSHTVKMKDKPISKGFKTWSVADHGYVWHFIFHSGSEGMTKS